MPNWVYNTLTITGEAEQVERFAKQAAQSYNTKHMKHVINGTEWDWVAVDEVNDVPLSFWNFVKPDESIVHEYWGEQQLKPTLAEAMKHDTNHWYDWNIRNWGCKWDAGDVQMEMGDGRVTYSFDTPWSPPVEALEAMCEQFPKLVMEMRSVEEQGWGVEHIADEDGVRIIAEWDIPDTHKESIENKGWCDCENGHEDFMFDDCPKKKELSLAGN